MISLAGDIGGTHARLWLCQFEAETSQLSSMQQQTYLCADFSGLTDIIQHFLQKYAPNLQIEQACLGLPGPVESRQVHLTNLPWVVDADELEQACQISRVILINDFFAAARGVETLSADDLDLLSGEVETWPLEGNRLVVGAGTGLGVAPVVASNGTYQPMSSEGGHFDLAPISWTQQLLLQWLWQRWEHVSYERVLSGPGLETLYEFFHEFDCPNSFEETSSGLEKTQISADTHKNGLLLAKVQQTPSTSLSLYNAVQVYEAALNGEPAAVKAMNEFVTLYGAFIGASALLWKAKGGIYIAGGIASKIIPWMRKPYFTAALFEKGRMSSLLKTMPVYLVTAPDLGLQGAMQHNLIMYGDILRSSESN